MDFSKAISIEYSTIIIPLRLKTDVWSLVHPFEREVWIAALAIIPVFTLAMSWAEYFSPGKINLGRTIGFVARTVLSEPVPMLPDDGRGYRRVLVIVWMWSFLVLGWMGSTVEFFQIICLSYTCTARCPSI